jgi:hypothetical protein
VISGVLAAGFAGSAHGGRWLKPYVLAWVGSGDLGEKTREVKDTLKKRGFEVVGEYTPFRTARVLAITNAALKRAAASSNKGGFGAVQRVTVTRVGGEIQVAFTNPIYWANAFRMRGSLASVARALENALGRRKGYGSKGLTAAKLRKYHYKVMMPYFTDLDELGEYDSHREAVRTVAAGLAARRGGVKRVYKVTIPGKNETVFGVQMTRGCSGEKHIMKYVDRARYRSTGFLPYQILVSGNKAYALRGRFRIAVSFPDLTMSTFMKIFCAPGAIQDALEAVATPRD